MTRTALMETVLRSLHASARPSLGHRDLSDIDPAGVRVLAGLGVLTPAPLATQATCRQCGEECTIDVEHVRGDSGDVVGVHGHCPDPGEESSFIRFDIDDVRVWRVETSALARRVCAWLGLGVVPVDVVRSHCWRLGQFKVSGLNRMVFFAAGCGCTGVPGGILKATSSAIAASPSPVLLLPSIKESQVEVSEDIPVVSLVSLLLASDDDFGMDAGALRRQIESWAADDGIQDIPGYRFSPDYLVVWRFDRMYSLTDSQAEVVRLLHKAWADKYRYLHTSFLTRNLSQGKIHDVFKGKSSMMRDLLVSDRQGNYALRLPDDE